MVPLTVALLTYNRAHYLRQSLEAIVDQTWGDFELLVLDNGSTDETPQVVLSFNDPRLRYVRNPPGSTARFNNMSALWLFRGERLLITHDDDIMEPDMLKRQMALIAAHPELTAVWTNKSIIDKHGKQVQAWFSAPGPDRIFARGEFIARAAVENLWHPPSSLIFSPRLQSLKKLQQAYLAATPPSRIRQRPAAALPPARRAADAAGSPGACSAVQLDDAVPVDQENRLLRRVPADIRCPHRQIQSAGPVARCIGKTDPRIHPCKDAATTGQSPTSLEL